MSEALDKLKEIGAQKIYEDTHIPIGHVQSILYESFEGLNKLQFLGFVSIIEREYGYDLSEVRNQGIAYFDELSKNREVVINEAIYKAPTHKKNFIVLYIILAIIIFIVAIIYTMNSAQESLDNTVQESKIVEDVKQNIIEDTDHKDQNSTQESKIIPDMNSSQEHDVNISNSDTLEEVNIQEEQVEPKAQVAESFIIEPTKRVWLGYIDVDTNKKYQKTFKGKLNLDPSKEWLLYFGHGYINIVIDGEKEKFADRHTLRLHYKDGKIEKISVEEFKRLNRGRKW